MSFMLSLLAGNMEHCLIRRQPITSSEIEVPDGEYRIGRAETADLCLISPMVSKEHAVLLVDEGVYKISDLGSANGTHVNGQQIFEPHSLQSGDEIMFAPFRFNVRFLKRPSIKINMGRSHPQLTSKIRVKTGVVCDVNMQSKPSARPPAKTTIPHLGEIDNTIFHKTYRLKRDTVAIWDFYDCLPRKWWITAEGGAKNLNRICLFGPLDPIPISEVFASTNVCEHASRNGFVLHPRIGHSHEALLVKILMTFINEGLLIECESTSIKGSPSWHSTATT